jgi:hypothetical protein
MSRTHRQASIWMETRFKFGDPGYPQENKTRYFNGRYQAKIRNGNHSYYTKKIDPLSYKVASWREYGRDIKMLAKRRARHNAKLLIIQMTHEILLEQQLDLEELWAEQDRYDEDYMGFDFSYSDEAYDYAEQRRLEELEDEQYQRDWWSTFDPYMDWHYL